MKKPKYKEYITTTHTKYHTNNPVSVITKTHLIDYGAYEELMQKLQAITEYLEDHCDCDIDYICMYCRALNAGETRK